MISANSISVEYEVIMYAKVIKNIYLGSKPRLLRFSMHLDRYIFASLLTRIMHNSGKSVQLVGS